jgi:hypothetical protein
MSRKHRHRDHKVKKMHSIIGNYREVLDDIGTIPEVQSVITGIISPNKSEFEELTFQYFTDSGLKLLAKTTVAVQEIFLVAKQKEAVLDELRKRGHLQERMRKVGKKQNKSNTAKPRTNTPQRDARYNAADAPKDAKPTTLKDLLSPEQLAKLTEQSHELKEQERVQQETKRKAEIERREREQKELDNNFEYLLNKSKMDWKNFK